MNVLIVGSGGREHALAWKISQSPRLAKLWVAPGNAGTASVAQNIAIGVDQFTELGTFCVEQNVDLVVVGPEGPLVKGIRDHFESDPQLRNIFLVGPGQSGARLEGSKDFSKQFMLRHQIPTAKARTFEATQLDEANAYLATLTPPIVLKADGLAAGKGVVIAQRIEEAQETMHEMLIGRKFGEASARVLVEEFLDGIELSVFVLTDGKDYVILPEAKDYKRIGDGDTGPNTGGMGAVSPVPFANFAFMKKVEERIIKPTISGLQAENIPYRGFIFIGLMNVKGEPYVIEYNARMGDPETQVVLTRIENDLLTLLEATAKGELKGKSVKQSSNHSVTISMVSGGYPGDYKKGFPIDGLQKQREDGLVFHGGTKMSHSVTIHGWGSGLDRNGNSRHIGRCPQYRLPQRFRDYLGRRLF